MFVEGARAALRRAYPELVEAELTFADVSPFVTDYHNDPQGQMYAFDGPRGRWLIAFSNGIWLAPKNGLFAQWVFV
jgi:hypothetical protein